MEHIYKGHKKEINKLIDYIYNNLDKELTMQDLSRRINLSPYHFHRIFSTEQGEPLGKFIQRIRIERAAALLKGDQYTPVTQIAYACGFSSATLFCRNFKKHFGVTAQEYRNSQRENSKNSLYESIINPNSRSYSRYFCHEKSILIGEKIMTCTFEIKNLAALEIIYCRHQGALDQMQDAFGKLIQWAYPRGLMANPEMRLLSVYHDDPRITETSKLTADAGMIINTDVKPEGEIGKHTIQSGLYAVGHFEISMEEFPDAWNATFRLLAEHGCTCTAGHHYEIYRNNRDEHPEKKFIVDICIPVKTK